ncbi:MAG: ATP synthase F1 subunit gamma [Rickettsiaceae bacterium]|nr:ATP synthase F1 subunit gamma [Rickettsiaceae bacterium]
MGNLKSLRLRIKSIKSTQKITKAMQMVSSSKLRQVRSALEAFKGYYVASSDIMSSIRGFWKEEKTRIEELLFNATPSKACVAIVVTSDRGLCGSFNQSILRVTLSDFRQMRSKGIEFSVITVGKNGRDALISNGFADNIILHLPSSSGIPTTSTSAIYEKLIELLDSELYDSCKLYFNSFKNSTTNVPTVKSLIPVDTTSLGGDYESDGEGLIEEIAKIYIDSQIYWGLLDSKVSEEAARMMAMDNATRNAGDMITKLTLLLNRSRQTSITSELIEIISGAEAL